MATFCSSLRRRRDWAPALSRFANIGPVRWREDRLQGHDIAFPVEPRAGQQRGVKFLSILLATDEINTSETKEKIERLCNLNGGQNVAILLLLKGEDAIAAFMRLQVQIHGWADVPIIPLSSAMDFPSRMEQLRKKSSESARQSRQRKRVIPIQFLLQQCVGGGDPGLCSNGKQTLS
uniref:Uncharacterized protein n=1 Tax=Bionectria ochroleuca TaxID=29856 RepID=A0A8H7NCN0_BIOOC